MVVVVAEKPSVAGELAKVLKAGVKKDGYFEGNGYQVTWCIGHMVELEGTEAYGQKGWSLESLPILPETFKLRLKDDPGRKSQFSKVKALLNEATDIVEATDAGREGELIFRYLYTFSGCRKPFKRLWISSPTDEAIADGFRNLKKGSEYDNMYQAAKSRSEADWLVGINATQALTLASGSGKTVLSLGRVQTPVLAMVAERYIQFRDFKPVPYFIVQLKLEKDGKTFVASHERKFEQRTSAESVAKKIGSTILCSLSEKKNKTELQPLLYDLTSLQVEVNKRHSFSAQKTLDLMQSLYETHKVLTYPRTSSRYLTDDLYRELPNVFTEVARMQEYTELIEVLVDTGNLPKRSVDASKVTDHHAIIPTGKKAVGLSPDEHIVFDMVVRRFIASFGPLCEKEVTKYRFTEGEEVFSCSGTVIKVEGWRLSESEPKEEKEELDENDQKLPDVSQGERLKVISSTPSEKKTTPKPIHTESSLLSLMETAGKEIEDSELSKAIKDCGIGTPATRASIIETLFARNYIERQKKNLVPTQLGLSVYGLVKDYPIANVEMTGEWELKINKIAEGSFEPNKFIDEIKEYASELVELLKESGSNIEIKRRKCPKCSSAELRDFPKALSCPNKEGCGFVVFKEVNRKRLSLAQVDKLLEKGKTDLIKGFRKKDSDKTFDAALKFDENFKVVFDFPELKHSGGQTNGSSHALVIGKCPKCKYGEVIEGVKAFGCSKYRENQCSFAIWKEISSRKISSSEAKVLLEKGKTPLLTGFKSVKGKFDAHLKLDSENKVVFEFPPKK